MRGLDQEPFADLIGISRGTVSNYERDSTDRYNRAFLKLWAAETGVSLDWIVKGDANHPGPTGGESVDQLERLTETKRRRTRSAEPRNTRGYLPAAVYASRLTTAA